MFGYTPHRHSASGRVHAVADGGDTTMTPCGLAITLSLQPAPGELLTCETCHKLMEARRDQRIALNLAGAARRLLADVDARPGAYIHADKTAIETMRAVLAAEQ